jgi:hypothetical protein
MANAGMAGSLWGVNANTAWRRRPGRRTNSMFLLRASTRQSIGVHLPAPLGPIGKRSIVPYCAPAAVAFQQNGFYVAGIGPDHNLYFDNFNDSSFSGCFNLGPYCLDGVAAASWGPDRLDFFTIGALYPPNQRPLFSTREFLAANY